MKFFKLLSFLVPIIFLTTNSYATMRGRLKPSKVRKIPTKTDLVTVSLFSPKGSPIIVKNISELTKDLVTVSLLIDKSNFLLKLKLQFMNGVLSVGQVYGDYLKLRELQRIKIKLNKILSSSNNLVGQIGGDTIPASQLKNNLVKEIQNIQLSGICSTICAGKPD